MPLKFFRHIVQNPQVKQDETGCFIAEIVYNYFFVYGYFLFVNATVLKFCKICLLSFLRVLTVQSFNVVILCKLYNIKSINFLLLCVFSYGVKVFPKQITRETAYWLHNGLVISRNVGDLSILVTSNSTLELLKFFYSNCINVQAAVVNHPFNGCGERLREPYRRFSILLDNVALKIQKQIFPALWRGSLQFLATYLVCYNGISCSSFPNSETFENAYIITVSTQFRSGTRIIRKQREKMTSVSYFVFGQRVSFSVYAAKNHPDPIQSTI